MRVIVFLLILVFTIHGCKKKSEPISQPYVDPCTYSSYYNVIQQFSVINNSLIGAKLFPDINLTKSCPGSKAPQNLTLNSLSLNSKSLRLSYDYWTLCYSDTIPQNTKAPYVWQLNGTESYPSFTETINDSLPRFTTFAQ